MTHCPGCDGILTHKYQPKRDNDVPCPGVTCAACQAKDAELQRMDNQLYRLGEALAGEKIRVKYRDAEIDTLRACIQDALDALNSAAIE